MGEEGGSCMQLRRQFATRDALKKLKMGLASADETRRRPNHCSKQDVGQQPPSFPVSCHIIPAQHLRIPRLPPPRRQPPSNHRWCSPAASPLLVASRRSRCEKSRKNAALVARPCSAACESYVVQCSACLAFARTARLRRRRLMCSRFQTCGHHPRNTRGKRDEARGSVVTDMLLILWR
jgi:hypothetical protein